MCNEDYNYMNEWITNRKSTIKTVYVTQRYGMVQ